MAMSQLRDEGMSFIENPNGLPDETLSEANRTRLLSDEAFALKSLGRLEDALGPQSIVHQRTWEAGDWNNFCRSGENLVSLLTPLGRWAEAEAVSREAVSVANGLKDKEERWQRTTTALAYLGHTLHGRGYLKQASTAYALAEIVQAEAHHHPKLYSIYGYNYAQLLLEQACQETGWREVLERRHTSLDIAVKLNHALSQALDHGTIGLNANAANVVPPQFDPKRYSLMVDWNPSEFSRIRLQYSRDLTRQDIATGETISDNQLFLQYIFSLGAHGAHQF